MSSLEVLDMLANGRQENQEFRASFGYLVSSRPDWVFFKEDTPGTNITVLPYIQEGVALMTAPSSPALW